MEKTENIKGNNTSLIRGRVRSFKNAFSGIRMIFLYEKNFRIHIIILALVICVGILLNISLTKWIAVLMVSGLVLASECFNTAVEYLGDAVSEVENELIKRAKDAAAAGVLISAVIAAIAGLVIFIPEILEIFQLTE